MAPNPKPDKETRKLAQDTYIVFAFVFLAFMATSLFAAIAQPGPVSAWAIETPIGFTMNGSHIMLAFAALFAWGFYEVIKRLDKAFGLALRTFLTTDPIDAFSNIISGLFNRLTK